MLLKAACVSCWEFLAFTPSHASRLLQSKSLAAGMVGVRVSCVSWDTSACRQHRSVTWRLSAQVHPPPHWRNCSFQTHHWQSWEFPGGFLYACRDLAWILSRLCFEFSQWTPRLPLAPRIAAMPSAKNCHCSCFGNCQCFPGWGHTCL